MSSPPYLCFPRCSFFFSSFVISDIRNGTQEGEAVWDAGQGPGIVYIHGSPWVYVCKDGRCLPRRQECVKSRRNEADSILYSMRRIFSICLHMYPVGSRVACLLFKAPLSACTLSCPFHHLGEDATLNISLQSTVTSQTGAFHSWLQGHILSLGLCQA